jgi:hypothetical protein
MRTSQIIPVEELAKAALLFDADGVAGAPAGLVEIGFSGPRFAPRRGWILLAR